MAYTYLGGQVMTYQDYLDTATGHMLTAVPASPPNEYDMTPVRTGLPVPPADGRWLWAEPLPPPPLPVVTATAPVTAPDPEPAPEGGVTDANA